MSFARTVNNSDRRCPKQRCTLCFYDAAAVATFILKELRRMKQWSFGGVQARYENCGCNEKQWLAKIAHLKENILEEWKETPYNSDTVNILPVSFPAVATGAAVDILRQNAVNKWSGFWFETNFAEDVILYVLTACVWIESPLDLLQFRVDSRARTEVSITRPAE